MSKLWGLSAAEQRKKVNMVKVSTICWQFMRCGTDVMYLLDTRLSEHRGQKVIKAIRELRPNGTFIRQSPLGARRTTRANDIQCHWPKRQPKPQVTVQGGMPEADTTLRGRVGGMLLIVSNKWSKHIKECWKDSSGYGVVSSVTIQGMSQVITMFGTYWPFQ